MKILSVSLMKVLEFWSNDSPSKIPTPETRPQTRELGTSGGHQKTVGICQYFGSHNRAPVRDKVEAVRAEGRAEGGPRNRA